MLALTVCLLVTWRILKSTKPKWQAWVEERLKVSKNFDPLAMRGFTARRVYNRRMFYLKQAATPSFFVGIACSAAVLLCFRDPFPNLVVLLVPCIFVIFFSSVYIAAALDGKSQPSDWTDYDESSQQS